MKVAEGHEDDLEEFAEAKQTSERIGKIFNLYLPNFGEEER